MKTTDNITSTTARQNHKSTSEPFFQKEGHSSFFSNTIVEEQPFFQPKLTIGKPNDKYEREADAKADEVVRQLSNGEAPKKTNGHSTSVNSTAVQAKCAECEKEEQVSKKEDRVFQKPIFESNTKEEGIQTKCETCAADEGKQVMAKAEGEATASPNLESQLNGTKGRGNLLPKETRSQMEGAFGADFSGVRIHTNSAAVQMNQELGAQAFTHGSDVYFNKGKYNTGSKDGNRLLAHELTHVVQQRGRANWGQAFIQRASLEEQLDKELGAWAEKNNKTTDPKNRSYAFDLHEYSLKLIADPSLTGPIKKPKGARKIKKWKIKFQKAQLLAKKILASSKNVEQRETRAAMILKMMAEAGFHGEAVTMSKKLKDIGEVENVYGGVLGNIKAASPQSLETMSKFYLAHKGNSDNPFIKKMTDTNGAFEKQLNAKQLTAILNPIITKHENADFIIDLLAEVLLHKKSYRKTFSDLMWRQGKGEFLFKILESKYFIEPDYGPTTFAGVGELKLEKDMPWVYANKQKFFTGFLVDLGKSTGINIPTPKNLKFKTLRKWLDDHTEKIGQAVAKKHPNDPAEWIKIYEQITDIFMYHVDGRNIRPDLTGKLSKLKPGAPAKKRLQVDCDVLAVYAMRYFFSIKDPANSKFKAFEPIGYMAIMPQGNDGHAVALMRRDGKYHVISNKQVFPKSITEAKKDAKKAAGIIAMREEALDVYDPKPDSYEVYYADAGKGGAMPRALARTQQSARRTDLEP